MNYVVVQIDDPMGRWAEDPALTVKHLLSSYGPGIKVANAKVMNKAFPRKVTLQEDFR